MAWQQRDDNVPGFIYIFKATGFHGWIPGCYLSRIKIGLSRDVDRRLDTLHSNQPCTDLEEIHRVEVSNMAEVETMLHEVFKKQNIQLIKSQEWFDLTPLQIQKCIWLMNRHRTDIKRAHNPISTKAIAGGLIALLGVGILIGQSFQPEPTKAINKSNSEKLIK